MGFEAGRPIILSTLALALCLFAGCGGSSSTSTGSTPPTAGFSKKAEAAAFGEEAAEEERAQASLTLERFMSARANRVYDVECETLSAAAVEAIDEDGGSCAGTLKAETENVPSASLVNNLEPIAALRTEGTTGFALYHAGDGQDYAMPMELESGEWKVAATQPETLPTN